MPILLVLAVLAGLVLVWIRRNNHGGDLPARIVAIAATRLPTHRRDWGQAMAAELTELRGRTRRWQFTAGVLRVALFPPFRHRRQVLAVAVAGLITATAATWAVAAAVPTLTVFAATLGLSLTVYATVVTARSQRPRLTAPRMIVGVLALTGVAATVATTIRIADAHPAATTDHSAHVVSVLFALVTAGYLALGLTPPRLRNHANTALWWATGGALVSAAVTITIALTSSAAAGVTAYLSPSAAIATLLISIGAAVTTHSRRVGAQAGLLTAVLALPIHFAVAMTTILNQHNYVLTDPYDIAAYPHSGYPDIASYVISDAIDANILAGLVLYPILLVALAILAASAGATLQRPTIARTAATS
jgi:hypothetical protein